jgi:hypothetical protein
LLNDRVLQKESGRLFLSSFKNRYQKPKTSFRHWKFSTARNWMESPRGVFDISNKSLINLKILFVLISLDKFNLSFLGIWQLIIADDFPGDDGTVQDIKWTFHMLRHQAISSVPHSQTKIPSSHVNKPISYWRPLPSPSPTPVPVPSPSPSPSISPHLPPSNSVPTLCCVYLSSINHISHKCEYVSLSECLDLSGWILSLSLKMKKEDCMQICDSSSSTTPPPTPKIEILVCCWYIGSNNEKKCLLAPQCPSIPSFNLMSDFSIDNPSKCDEFCAQ